MLITVWTLSTMISVPPLFYPPWGIPYTFQDEEGCDWSFSINQTSSSHQINSLNQSDSDDQPTCYLSETTGYVMYSVFGSFYIPTCIMVFVYIKIFIAAR
ncbi:tyramine receptor 1-like [Eurytemora carolleeae]|uniref:tyramine receptor 1-like n=1 Tax=Eurytemora carolleeae TaxID=1294199 RepID=UPI000C782C06|nr:tyramine receptor 1-like [Eurytemora carolleeae]|eukprot:XP_023348825.1 tyramine receptor 1-like [Eurytemora affinis]